MISMSLSRSLNAIVVTGLLSVPVVASAQTNPVTTGSIAAGSITARLQPYVTIPGADGPGQDLTFANDDSGRVFIATRNGRIDVVNNGTLSSTPFLNLNATGSLYTGGEGGFPGLAFSPTFATDKKFYTFTTENYVASNTADFGHPELMPTTGTVPTNQIVIREWTQSDSNPNVANMTSRVLMRINHPDSNHQGGGLKFGGDGNLYISLGDGGGANDNNGGVNSTTDGHTNATGNAQDTSVVFGKILRIDPRGNNSANKQYGIPSNNPFVAGGGLKEIYAYGLRNPYRISFDRATNLLYAGDVGQGSREEVDNITNGGNYGWVYREGTIATPGGRTAPGGFTSIDPIAEYTHGDGDAIQGGFVYRGSAIPALVGKYVFGDYQGTSNLGRLFYMDAAGGTISEFKYDLTNGGASPSTINSQVFGFGEGANGELYALFANGQILQFVPEPGTASVLLIASVTVLRRRRRQLRL